MYGIRFFSDWLYTIDTTTGLATPIVYTGCCVLGIAVQPGSGRMYGYTGGANASLISINRTTGASTIIGPLGFDASYGGMDFDDSDGTLYLFAQNAGTGQSELRTVDLATGATTLIGAIPFSITGAGIAAPAPPSLSYFTLAPCRVVDTRGGAPIGGPVMQGQETRSFAVAGQCGIPQTAKAISINVAVTQASAGGNIRLFPAGQAVPGVSYINYEAGQTRSNNALTKLNGSGAIAAFVGQPAGTTVHLIIDVNGTSKTER